jgi:hypothetical protein
MLRAPGRTGDTQTTAAASATVAAASATTPPASWAMSTGGRPSSAMTCASARARAAIPPLGSAGSASQPSQPRCAKYAAAARQRSAPVHNPGTNNIGAA